MKKGDTIFWNHVLIDDDGKVQVGEGDKPIIRSQPVTYHCYGQKTVMKNFNGKLIYSNETVVYGWLQDSPSERMVAMNPEDLSLRPREDLE